MSIHEPPKVKSEAKGGGDPFARMYHMSTTAGVGLHDYVALNTPAIVAGIGGILFCWMAFVSPILVVIPIVNLVVGIIGLVQIRSSNGTQTGKLWAITGIVLAGGMVAAIAVQQQVQSRAFETSKTDIGNMFSTLNNDLAAGEYDAGYQLFGPVFQERVKLPEFSGWFKMAEGSPYAGRVKELAWNNALQAGQSGDDATADLSKAVVQCRFEKSAYPMAVTITLVRHLDADGSKGPWRIEGMSPFFDPKPPTPTVKR